MSRSTMNISESSSTSTVPASKPRNVTTPVPMDVDVPLLSSRPSGRYTLHSEEVTRSYWPHVTQPTFVRTRQYSYDPDHRSNHVDMTEAKPPYSPSTRRDDFEEENWSPFYSAGPIPEDLVYPQIDAKAVLKDHIKRVPPPASPARQISHRPGMSVHNLCSPSPPSPRSSHSAPPSLILLPSLPSTSALISSTSELPSGTLPPPPPSSANRSDPGSYSTGSRWRVAPRSSASVPPPARIKSKVRAPAHSDHQLLEQLTKLTRTNEQLRVENQQITRDHQSLREEHLRLVRETEALLKEVRTGKAGKRAEACSGKRKQDPPVVVGGIPKRRKIFKLQTTWPIREREEEVDELDEDDRPSSLPPSLPKSRPMTVDLPKLELQDLEAMYKMVDGRMVCRCCLESSKSPAFSIPRPLATLDALVHHCVFEHPIPYSDEAGLSMWQVYELRKRLVEARPGREQLRS